MNKYHVRRCFSKAHSKIVYCRIVKINLKILYVFREECLSCERHVSVGRPLCVAENIFQGMRNPGIGFIRIQDGLMAKTNREEKSYGMPGRARGDGEGGQREGAGRNLPLRQHCESAHLAESCAAAAATDPPTPTGDEKGRENERRAKSRCGASRLPRVREKERERGEEGKRKRRVQGEVHKGLDAEISVTCSSCQDFNAARRWKSNRDKVCDYFVRYDKRRFSVLDVV